MPYDPNNPGYSSSDFLIPLEANLNSSLTHSSMVMGDGSAHCTSPQEFFYRPENYQFYDKEVAFRDHVILYDSRDIEFTLHNGIDTFRAVNFTETVAALLMSLVQLWPEKNFLILRTSFSKSYID